MLLTAEHKIRWFIAKSNSIVYDEIHLDNAQLQLSHIHTNMASKWGERFVTYFMSKICDTLLNVSCDMFTLQNHEYNTANLLNMSFCTFL